MLFSSIPQAPNKIGDETLELFRQVIEADLKSYGTRIARERGLDEGQVLGLIPDILNIPIMDKINEHYLDTSQMKYRKELNKYNGVDLKEICRRLDLKMTGTRDDYIQRISDKLGLVEFSQLELETAKSFTSKPIKSTRGRKKKTNGTTLSNETPTHYVSDSD